MNPTVSGRFLTVLLLSFGLVVPAPALSASPKFFESLRNEPDTGPSRGDTDSQRPEPTSSPSLRKSRPDTGESREDHPSDSGRELPSPEVRSGGETHPSVRVVIPPSNTTLRPGDTDSVSRRSTHQSSRAVDEAETGVWFSRAGRSFEDRFFVGMRWPGVSVGLRESPYTLELKHLEESDDVKITGVRLYHHLLRVDATNVYWGVDLSRVSFEGDVSEGTGNSTGLYAGFEKRLWNRFSWSVDIGPYYIHLRDDATNITADGLEFTLTTGLNVGFL